MEFKNGIGLAAGFDKNASYIDILSYLGFGFIEVGTVTPRAQKGNPKPRLFRLKKDTSLINRMGFNNKGLDNMIKNLKKRSSNIIVGGNIGKNKNTPNEEAVNDYLACFKGLFHLVDYFVVNVSSPNTPGLRELQEKSKLQEILSVLQDYNYNQKQRKPILLKISPDLSKKAILDILGVVKCTNIDGVVCNNTTVNRANLKTSQHKLDKIGKGGLSGAAMYETSNSILSFLCDNIDKNKVVIGVGGITNPSNAKEKIKLGANLLQVYTGFIYKGPSLIQDIKKRWIN